MGNELIFEGKKYISSRRASQITGYNSDYIGQLCRKGALECKLVGRSWFVEEKSLSEHEQVASKTPRGRIPLSAKIPEKKIATVSSPISTSNSLPVSRSEYEVVKMQKTEQTQGVLKSALQEEVPAYDSTPFLHLPHETVTDKFFTRKIVAICAAIILCVFGAPFLLRENNTNHIDTALRVTSTIAREINSSAVKQIASVSSSIKNTGLALAIQSDAIHDLRIKTHEFTLRTYHVISLLPSMFFDTAHTMKRIVMRENKTNSNDEGTNDQAVIDSGSAAPGVRSGITVVPSSGDAAKDEKIKQYIKDSFSDETKVVPDNTGTSGVIKPIFKKQSDQDYLYVIVPVKQ